MKNNLLLTLLIVTTIVFTSCRKDENRIEPVVGLWELNDVEIDALGSEFDYVDETGLSSLVGETAHTVELKADFSYERILTIPFSDGTLRVLDETGVWGIGDDNLSLSTGFGEIFGIPYEMTVISVSSADLVLGYSGSREYFPQSKIDEWLADGTIDEDGFFTVSTEEVNDIYAKYLQVVLIDYILEFAKQ